MEKEIMLFFQNKKEIKFLQKDINITDPKYSIFDLDAEYIMENFFQEFNINYIGFDICKYFQYPDYSWKLLIKKILKRKINYPIKKPLTIGHLIKVAEKGEWFEPEE